MKKIVQVKYCYSENELNEFLKTLSATTHECPFLHSIQYCAKVEGSGVEKTKADDNDVIASVTSQSSVVAAVQYITEID